MRKTIVFFVSIVLLGINFTSCSSNDDAPASVVGKWNYSKTLTSINGVASPEEDYENEPGCSKDYFELKSGGAFDAGDYSGSSCTLDKSVGTWTQNGSTITIVTDKDTFSGEVVSVSSTVLKIKTTETSNGFTVAVVITFTKA